MRRSERVGLTASVAVTAAGLLLIGACSTQVSGTAVVNEEDLAAYAAEVTASASLSRAAAADQATMAACDTFATTNDISVEAFNAYIEIANTSAPDNPEVARLADTAVTMLRGGAAELDAALTSAVEPAIADPMRTYLADTNNLADTLESRAPIDALNVAVDQFNASKDAADTACIER